MRFSALTVLISLSLTAWSWQGPTGDISGRILDLKNEPVGGVTMVFTHEHEKGFNQTYVTKDNGAFVMRNVPAGPVTIEATKEGYTSRTYKYEQDMGKVKETFRMVPEGTTYESLGPQPELSGTLTDRKGNPLAEASIKITSEDLPGFELETTTDASGAFSSPSLENALVQLHAAKEGYRDQLYRFYQGKKEYKVKGYELQTMEEYFKEIGQPMPGKKEKTPEEQAVAFYNQAVDPFKNKDYDQAESLIHKALELNPEMGEAHKMMVYLNHNQQKWEQSLASCEKYLALNPGDTRMMQFAEEAARFAGNDAAAAKYEVKLKEMGVIEKDTPDSLYNKAVDALNKSDDAKAQEYLTKVLEMDSKYADAYREMGMILAREYEFEAAVEKLKLFLKYAPSSHPKRAEVTDLIVTLSE